MLLIRRDLITNLSWIFLTVLLIFTPFIANTLFFALDVDNLSQIPTGLLVVLFLFWHLFTFGYFFVNYLNWFFNVHLITSKRVVDMDFAGVLYRNISDAPLRNVEDVTHTISGTLEVIFNYGTVYIQTAGEQKELEFTGVPDPAKIQDFLSDLVATKRSK